MEKVLSIIEQLQATSRRNDKESILKQNESNELFKKVMYFIYNPYILTGISKKKISKKLKLPTEPSTLSIIEIMDYLQSHNSGRDSDIQIMQHFIQSQPEHLRELYTKIITKDLSIGITADTINKVYGNYIPSFSCMLAKKYEDHGHKIKGNFVISEKLDGNRILIVKENGIAKSFTRTGNPYEGLEEIEQDIISLPIDNYVFDGELIADMEGSTIEVYAETTSKARSKGKNKTGLIFNIFDLLPLSEFQNGQSKKNCVERKNDLLNVFSFHSNILPHCKEVKSLYVGSDLEQIGVWASWASNNGLEGIMVNLDKPYTCKRSDVILKVKVFNDADVRCLDVIEGTGKNEGKLGSITIQFEHEGNLYECNCGSGFSDEERELYYNQPELIIGKIVTVGYFEISKNSNGDYGLRFPSWKSIIRHDKTEISMY
jgi:DNA ligase 1